MKTVLFSELSNLENFTITSIFSMNQHWNDGQTFHMREPRKQSALLWFCGGRGEIHIAGVKEPLIVPQGALISIPEKQVYSIHFLDPIAPVTSILLEFCLANDQPFSVTQNIEILDPQLTDQRIIDLLCNLTVQFSMLPRPWLDIRKNVYHLFFILSEKTERAILRDRGFRTIEKGIRHLQTEENQDLSIEEIARMCFVTPAYFRRLFREYMGCSPMEYRGNRKVENAKHLFEHSSMSVSEVSDMLGFDNPSYFARVFKKHTGMSPSEFRKLNDD